MKERIGHSSNDLLSQTDSDAKDDHDSMTSFEASIRNKSGSLLGSVSTHSNLRDNGEKQVLEASKDDSAVFEHNKDSVLSVKTLPKQFSAAQQAQLDTLTSEQIRLLANLNDQVGEHITQQTAMFNNCQTSASRNQSQKLRT